MHIQKSVEEQDVENKSDIRSKNVESKCSVSESCNSDELEYDDDMFK